MKEGIIGYVRGWMKRVLNSVLEALSLSQQGNVVNGGGYWWWLLVVVWSRWG